MIHQLQTIARRRGVTSGLQMVLTSHFSKKTLTALSRKGVEVVGTMAVPAFEGDQYFSGTAYILNAKGTQLIRTHSQVLVMGTSSWTPEQLNKTEDKYYMSL